MHKGESQQLTKKRRGGNHGRTGPKRAQVGRPRPAGLGRFRVGSRHPLTCMLRYKLPLPPLAATSIHSSESCRHEGEVLGGSRRLPQVLELPRRWLRLDPSRHGWPCVVKAWWSSGAMPWIHQGTCTFDGDINLILSFDLL
jgi:hypothetical protein